MSEQWSEWIEHTPGNPCPIPWAKAEEWMWRLTGADEEGHVSCRTATSDKDWGCQQGSTRIVGFRYRLDRAPAGFVPPGQLWYPPQVPGFGPWVEWPGRKQPPSRGAARVLFRGDRDLKRDALDEIDKCEWLRWEHNLGEVDIVAYALKLEDQPTAAEVESTQQPWSLEQDAADWEADSVEANRPMFDRDAAGIDEFSWPRFDARAALPPATPAPPFMVGGVRSSDGLLTEWPVGDHRLGRFV